VFVRALLKKEKEIRDRVIDGGSVSSKGTEREFILIDSETFR